MKNNRDNSNTDKSIIIGNKNSDIQKAFIIVQIASLVFAAFIASMIYSTYHLTILPAILIAVVLCLVNSIILTSFLTVSVRYWEIDEEQIQLADSSKFKYEFQGLLNIVFHTHYDVINAQIYLADIENIVLYAVEDYRVGRMFGDPGYCLRIRIVTRDGANLVIPDWFDYKDSKFVEGIDFLSNHGIRIVDRMNLMEIIRKNESITEYLNRGVSR